MKKWLVISASFVILASVIFVSCKPAVTPTPEKEPYVLGIIGSMTGPMAISYLPMVDGMRIYLERVNDQGGINGRQVKILIEDSKSSPAEAAVAARKLTELGVHLLAAPDGSPTYGAYETEVKRANIPLIIGGTPSPGCLPPTPDPLIYNAMPWFATEAVATLGATKLVQYGGKGNIGAFTTLDAPVMRIAGAKVVERGKEYGLADVLYKPIPTGTLDLTPVALAFKESGASAATHLGSAGFALMLYDALKKVGWEGVFVALCTEPVEYFFDKLKGEENVVVATTAFVPFKEDLPVQREIKAAAEKYGVSEVVSSLSLGWEEGMVIEAIFKEVGWPVTTDKLVGVMRNFEFKRPLAGTLKWTDENHSSASLVVDYMWDKAKEDWAKPPSPILWIDAWGKPKTYEHLTEVP